MDWSVFEHVGVELGGSCRCGCVSVVGMGRWCCVGGRSGVVDERCCVWELVMGGW